jgi:hypothetical protein
MQELANQPEPQRRTETDLTTADIARTSESTINEPINTSPEERAEADRRRWQSQDGQTASRTPLFQEHEAGDLRSRWTDVQAQFVDDPQNAVQDADHLVAEAVQKLSQVFATERENLERQWSGGGDVSTEDLRIALQRYRSFFDRLLAA